MKNRLYIALFVLVGFLLNSAVASACGSMKAKTERSCSKESKNKVVKNCCENGCDKNNEKGCKGKCGQTACTGPTQALKSIVSFENSLFLMKAIGNKPIFYYQETYYSSGFISIWSPPKIS